MHHRLQHSYDEHDHDDNHLHADLEQENDDIDDTAPNSDDDVSASNTPAAAMSHHAHNFQGVELSTQTSENKDLP